MPLRSPQILTQSVPPVDLSVAYIRWQIAAAWLEITLWPQWTAHRKPPLLFRSLIPYNFPSPKIAIPHVSPGPTLQHVLPPGENGRYRDSRLAAVSCAGCHYERGDVAFCQIRPTSARVFST